MSCGTVKHVRLWGSSFSHRNFWSRIFVMCEFGNHPCTTYEWARVYMCIECKLATLVYALIWVYEWFPTVHITKIRGKNFSTPLGMIIHVLTVSPWTAPSSLLRHEVPWTYWPHRVLWEFSSLRLRSPRARRQLVWVCVLTRVSRCSLAKWTVWR